MDASIRTPLHSCEYVSIVISSCPSHFFLGEFYFFVQAWLGVLVLFLIQRVFDALGSLHRY